MTYAAGWTPCVGPIFSAVLMLGATNPEGALYITAYTLGFAVPFFVMAFFIGKVKWIVTYANVMMKIGGGMMIVTGILLYTNQMTKITAFFIRLFGGFTGFKMRRKKSEETNCYYTSRCSRLGGVNFIIQRKKRKANKQSYRRKKYYHKSVLKHLASH